MKQKLLFINNYHCTLKLDDSYPMNHLWGGAINCQNIMR